MPTTGTVKVLALLIEFPDHLHSNTQAAVHDKLFGAGDPALSPYESVATYYTRASYGLLSLTGNTLGWYQTAYNRSTIPETVPGREALLKEVFTHYDGQGHDFSQYDSDGDGAIDYFIVVWTGPTGAWATFWWGYYTRFSDPAFTVDGVRLGSYSWQRETTPFNPQVVIHETGHALGLPDYYDYDDTVGPDGGVGGLDVMHSNRHDHGCFSKFVLDWITPTFVASGSHSLTLQASGTSSNSCVVMWPDITSDDLFSEFFVVQNRHRVGNDVQLPGDGMLIWHVDATLNAGGTNFLYNNSFTNHKLLRPMEADGLEEIEAGGAGDADDYWKPAKAFNQTSTPSSKKYDGSDSNVEVFNFTTPAPAMSATFRILTAESSPGTVVAFAGEAAAIPTGWLLCDGAAVSRTTYANLFGAIGTAHGSGDGSTTFNLPDYRGYFLRGVDKGAGNDPDVATRTPVGPAPWTGQQVGSRQDDATRSPRNPFTTSSSGGHVHTYPDSRVHGQTGTFVDAYQRGTNDHVFKGDVTRSTATAGQHQHNLSGGDGESRPKNKYVHWIIKF